MWNNYLFILSLFTAISIIHIVKHIYLRHTIHIQLKINLIKLVLLSILLSLTSLLSHDKQSNNRC